MCAYSEKYIVEIAVFRYCTGPWYCTDACSTRKDYSPTSSIMCHFVLVKWEKKFCPVSLHSRHIWLFLNMLLTNYQGRGGCQSKATDLLWNGLWQKNWRRQIFCYFCSGNNIKPWRCVCGLLFWIYCNKNTTRICELRLWSKSSPWMVQTQVQQLCGFFELFL